MGYNHLKLKCLDTNFKTQSITAKTILSSLTEASKDSAVATEKCNITKTQDNDFKIATINMFKDLRKDTSKSISENTDSAM